MSSKQKLVIFDTTLRDGEQTAGVNLNQSEKLEIAYAVRDLGVDVIEAGFPITSVGDFEAVKLISEKIRDCSICGLSRAIPKDIDRAAEALKKAAHPRIHVFMATSPIHRQYKFNKAKEYILETSVAMVKYAKKLVADVEFSPEDASRTEPDYLAAVTEAVIAAGATTVNIPDTVGYAMPEQYGQLIRYLFEHVRNIDKAIISVHCHNDLGLAVANSLAAVKAGARQVECTMNGLGERAGNCSLEEVVMGVKTRKDFFDNVAVNIQTKNFYKTSRLVSTLTGVQVQRNKAIVGENAFAHESGIHQDGILKKRETYEVMNPRDVGVPETKMVLGKLSGRHAFKIEVKKMGYALNDEDIEKAFVAFKALCDKKKEVYPEDVAALIETTMGAAGEEMFELKAFQITSGLSSIPTATVRVARGGIEATDAATGDGPIHAGYVALERVTNFTGRVKLLDYKLRAVTIGKDAQGEVTVVIEVDGSHKFQGRGISTDILEASARAYLSALNRAARALHANTKTKKVRAAKKK